MLCLVRLWAEPLTCCKLHTLSYHAVAALQGRKYAFKCHRKTDQGKEVVYPINAMSFHPSGTFATGGALLLAHIFQQGMVQHVFVTFPSDVSFWKSRTAGPSEAST